MPNTDWSNITEEPLPQAGEGDATEAGEDQKTPEEGQPAQYNNGRGFRNSSWWRGTALAGSHPDSEVRGRYSYRSLGMGGGIGGSRGRARQGAGGGGEVRAMSDMADPLGVWTGDAEGEAASAYSTASHGGYATQGHVDDTNRRNGWPASPVGQASVDDINRRNGWPSPGPVGQAHVDRVNQRNGWPAAEPASQESLAELNARNGWG